MKKFIFSAPVFILFLSCFLFLQACKTSEYKLVSKENFKNDQLEKDELDSLNYMISAPQDLILTKIKTEKKTSIRDGMVYEEIKDTIFSVKPGRLGSLKYIFREDGFDNFYISYDSRVQPLPFRIKGWKAITKTESLKDGKEKQRKISELEREKYFILFSNEKITTNTGNYPVIWVKNEEGEIVDGWVQKSGKPEEYILKYKKIKKEKSKVIKAKGDPVSNKK